MCFSKCILLILMIFHLSSFLSAQVLLNATVQVSTSWMINDLSFGNVSINDDALSTRFILRQMIDRWVGFACGFVSKGDDKSFVFAIGVVHYYSSGIVDLSVDSYENLSGFEMVWFANRNKPVSENGTLHLLPDGNLVLRDADGTFVWSTYTSMRSVIGMKLMETGNLVLYDSYNRTVWQSFDHPSDTLLNATVQVSTSWMINDLSFGNVSIYDDALSTRFILRKMINKQVGFACGFVSKGDDKSFIFAIGIVKYHYSGIVDLSVDSYENLYGFEMVWFANRNKPVSENGTLHFLPDGNVVLRDADGTFVWSTYTSMRSVIGMKLMETGNLVLYDSNNRTVWQSFDHPPDTLLNATVQVSTSWMINDLSFSTRFISTRFILRKMINKTVGFACGFVSKGDDKSFIFAIGIVQYYSDIADLSVDSYEYLDGFEMVWFANRNKPVSENGTLHLLPDGNLVLRDADGTFVWSTYTSMRSVIGMKLMETGNLVLYDSYNRTVWQSFDHPSDTLLDGQKLIAGQKLVARVSSTNWDEGDYYLSVTSQGLFAFYKQQLYFKFLIQGTRKTVETSYVKSVNGTLALYISSTEPSEPDAVFSKPSNMSMMRMKLDNDGHFKVYSDQTEPIDLLADFLSACDYPRACGNLELCSDDICSCPAKDITTPFNKSTYICSEISPITCNGSNSHKLVEIPDVSYFSFVDPNAAAIEGTDVESCRQACLRNCSCKAALFRYFYNVSHGNCFLPSPVFSLINNFKRRSLDQSSAFIKISGDLAKESQPSVSVRQIGLIAGLSLGACVLVVIAICFMLLRKKRSIEEDEDDNFDQVSGMPLRFSYEELKLATENFAIKLGEGGFGSVFEGSLSNGEKIAVKRLDGLGQGKKEFLAEVKTIGSIHHVNLVRLIGFCADKQQRLLVYEFMGNGSLDKWIFCRNMDQPTLNWQERRNIVLDIAKGLAYLHEECRQRIVHLDIKPQNILLDENQRAKVSDFGLSKFIDRDQSHTVTTMRGTPGYLAPEWLTSAITEKADVYSYGIVVMEIICGRKNLDRAQPEECMHLLRLFMKKAQENKLIDLIDKNSDDMQVHRLEAVEMMRLAAWCLQHEFTRRPSMSVVVKVIEDVMDIEADLNYSFSNPPTVAAVRGDPELRNTATLLPSVLSGPR